MTLAEIDLRVGGKWRYVMIADGGFEVAFHGEYREIVPDERIVTTEVFEGMPDGGARGRAVNIVTFTEADGRTTLDAARAGREQGARATRSSTPAWRAACRTRWTCWSRSPCARLSCL